MSASNVNPPSITLTAEGSGFVLTCECQWTRYSATRLDADTQRRDHAKKCKGPKLKAEAAPKRARSIGWDDREGATWIDQL